jgi:hypothetical protein
MSEPMSFEQWWDKMENAVESLYPFFSKDIKRACELSFNAGRQGMVFEHAYNVTEKALELSCEKLSSCPYYDHNWCPMKHEGEYPDCNMEQSECWKDYFISQAKKEGV